MCACGRSLVTVVDLEEDEEFVCPICWLDKYGETLSDAERVDYEIEAAAFLAENSPEVT